MTWIVPKARRTSGLVVPLCLWVAGCATTVDIFDDDASAHVRHNHAEAPAVESGPTNQGSHSSRRHQAPEPHVEVPAVDVHPVDARRLERTPPAAFAAHSACGAQVQLRRSSPVLFEDSLVAGLRDVEFDLSGPAGLIVAVEGRWRAQPPWSDVRLPPQVALELPAGPAADAPAGASGALFDLGALAVAGFANLVLLPITLPLAILADTPDAFFFEAPTFAEGMFVDVVFDRPTWEAEVQRRSAPHREALAMEAKRQARFAAFRDSLHLEQQLLGCTLDEQGGCTIHVHWPTSGMAFRFSGLPCATPVPTSTTSASADDGGDGEADASTSSTVDVTATVTATLPALPPLPTPRRLAVPLNVDETRGDGANATLETWRHSGVVRVSDAEAVFRSARRRGKPGAPLHDSTLVCRIRVPGRDYDVDGSAPDIRTRLAWGFDQDVAGVSFGEVSTHTLTVGVQGVSLVPGELVKLSLVDVDAFVDDWIAMDIAVFDGTLPLRFSHPRFTAECRAP